MYSHWLCAHWKHPGIVTPIRYAVLPHIFHRPLGISYAMYSMSFGSTLTSHEISVYSGILDQPRKFVFEKIPVWKVVRARDNLAC